MIRIHKDYDALKTGSLIFLNEEEETICYGRFDERDRFVIAVNSGGAVREINVPVWQIEEMDYETMMMSLITSTENGYSLNAQSYRVSQGFMKVTLYPYSSVVIKNMNV
jgi:alpha-glucosidase